MNIDDRTYKFFFKELQPGLDGVDGKDGADGISSTVEVAEIENGHSITFTDVKGTKTVNLTNGKEGKNGTDGQNGLSPTLAVSADANGHTVTVTDAEGTRSFHVLDGVSPSSANANALTGYLLSQNYDDLMTLPSESSADPVPTVRLIGNRVTETALTASTDSAEKCFLISKSPKYLEHGVDDLSDADLITFNYDHGMNLYCRISGYVQTMTNAASTVSPSIIISAKPSNQSSRILTTCDFKCGSGGNGIAQFGDVVFPVDDGDLRHESITLSVAVMVNLHPYYQNVDLTIEFYFGQIDLNSELAQNVNVFGTYNNSMYAERAYQKDDLIVRNDRLYKANWDISKGNRMDSDYDIKLTSISDELKELRALIQGT